MTNEGRRDAPGAEPARLHPLAEHPAPNGAGSSAERSRSRALAEASTAPRASAEHSRSRALAEASTAPRASAKPGRGILGMRERCQLLGGELVARPLPGGGFEVKARLPVAPTGTAQP